MEKKSAPTSFLSSNAGGKRKELKAVMFYQRQPFFKRKGERNVRVSTNLHGFDRLARPTWRGQRLVEHHTQTA